MKKDDKDDNIIIDNKDMIEKFLNHSFINKSAVARLLCDGQQKPFKSLERRVKRGKVLMGDSRDDKFMIELKKFKDICDLILETEKSRLTFQGNVIKERSILLE